MIASGSLRRQTLRIVIFSLAVLMGGAFFISSAVLFRSFSKIEHAIAVENMQRVRQAFENIRESLVVKSQDWSDWDDTYQFIIDRNEKYLISNLSVSSLSTLQVNHVMLLDEEGNEVFRQSLNFDSLTEAATPRDLVSLFKPGSELLRRKGEGDFTSGVLMVSGTPTVFVSRPVLNSHGQGPAHGSLVFAQSFDRERLVKLSNTVKLNLRIVPFDEKTPKEIDVRVLDARTMAGYCPVYDVFGKPAFVFYVDIPRHIFKQAQLSAAIICGLLILISLVFIFVIFFAIDRLFLQRMMILSEELARWNSTGKIFLKGDDELTRVADKINEMLEKIKESQTKIIDDELRLHDKDKQLLSAQQTKVAELEKINALVTQRTKELERMHIANLNILEDFREAKKQAEAASEAKGQFLANMSHEIRTPLNAILGFSDLLQRTELDDKQRKYLETVVASGKSLLMIVGDILEITKVEAKKVILENVDFDLVKTCQTAFDIVSQRVATKKIQMEIEISKDLPVWVKGDPVRLSQILMNVLGNAVKFTQEGSIKFIVKPQPRLDEEGKMGISFEVCDTGIGIEKDKIPNLFKMFTQVDGSTTRKYGGIGLGLAIAKNFAQLMGGDISVESQLGVGSVFTITAVFATGRQEGAAKKDMTILPLSDSLLSVLVVEDSIPNQQLMKAYFKILGVHGEFMNDGREAVDHLRSKSDYTLVFMDMQMPVMGGCEAARIIRKEISTEIPIVALTAAATKEDQDECLKAGMNDFLTKPIDIGRLKEVIKRYAAQKASSPVFQEEETLRSGIMTAGQEIGLDPQEYKELLGSAIKVIDDDRKALVDAITKEDHAAVKSLAHKFKGTLGNLRLKDLAGIAKEIEDLAAARSSWHEMLAKEKDFETVLEKIRKVIS